MCVIVVQQQNYVVVVQKSKKFGTVGKYPLELQGVNTPCKQMNPNLSCTSSS